MSKEPSVSLIMPVFNGQEFLPRIFSDLLYQDYAYLEVVLVDDGSTDDSLSLMERFARESGKKCRVVSKTNGGLNSARLAGIESAYGDYVAFVDADDRLEKDYISSLVSNMTDDVDVVFGPIITETPEGTRISVLNEARLVVEDWNKEEALEKLFRNYEVGNFFPGKLFRKSLFNGVDFSFSGAFEDYTVTHAVFNNCRKIRKIDHATYHYVKRGSGSLSSKTKESYLSCIEAIMRRREWVLSHYAGNMRYLNLVDDSLFDRFIQTASSFLIKKTEKVSIQVRMIYKENKRRRKLNTYCKRNLPLYFLSPKLYLWMKRRVARAR